MKRIATSNAVADLFGEGKDGFRDGNKAAGIQATQLSALWCNHLQEAIIRTIEAAGLPLSDTDFDQFPNALMALITANSANSYSINNLPTTDIGPVLVIECAEVWLWSTSAYFTGYRSPLCGRPLDGHTVTPLVSEIDAVGGTLSKAAYPQLWGYAQENALVVAVGDWIAGTHHFVDLGGDDFRVPDLRNQFRRYTGTDLDTANATLLGGYKADTIKAHTHATGIIQRSGGATEDVRRIGDDAATQTGSFGTAETAPKHTYFLPRIHV
ncbi:MAG: phage tail protein [Oxalobacter sp.]|nr:MAG: phage tail protein [Oxalobacter sp.]